MGRLVVLVFLLLSLSLTVPSPSPSEQKPTLSSTDPLPSELSEQLRACHIAAAPGAEDSGECASVRGASTASSILEQEAERESAEGFFVDGEDGIEQARGEARAGESELGGAYRGEDVNAAKAASAAGVSEISEQDVPRGEDLELGGWMVLPFSVQSLVSPNVSLRLRGDRIARTCRFEQVCVVFVAWAKSQTMHVPRRGASSSSSLLLSSLELSDTQVYEP